MLARNNSNDSILQVNNLKKYYPVKNSFGLPRENLKAVDDVSFKISMGETLGLVGETGCGKSTVGRTIIRLTEPTAGEAICDGQDIFQLSKKELLNIRNKIQIVFQDPYTALNPRKRIGQAIEECLMIHGVNNKAEREDKTMDILNKVGLQPECYYRYPMEFSGGQRQRIGLARALILNPKIIICDEPVSALDVSIQAQIINLLKEIQEMFGLAYLFIAHDLSVVYYITDRICVMYLGRIVEEARTEDLFSKPAHPYTKALLSAVPALNPSEKKEKIKLIGEPPSPIYPPPGCTFHPRCPEAMSICKESIPEKKELSFQHTTSCHLY